MGAGGGRFGFRRRTLRRVVVVFFFVWASMSGGVTAHTVSAARMAILIFRENIYPFINCDCQLLDETASDGENGAIPDRETLSLQTCGSLGIYPGGRYFPRITPASYRVRRMNG
jgi:hypothetical protein